LLGRRAAVCAGVTLALVLARPAVASTINCGDTLGAGAWLLETDLVCDSASGFGVAVTLGSGADLDLGGHTISMTIGGSGTDVVISGTGAAIHGGTLRSAETALLLTGGGGSRVHDLVIGDLVNTGIFLKSSNGNELRDCDASGTAIDGVFLESSDRNRLDRLTVNDTSGIGPAAGIGLLNSNENAITRSQVLRSQCTGINLRSSSRNVICGNAVQDTFVFLNGPAVDILLRDASTQNLVCKNQVSATKQPAVTSDGINVGCKGGCSCGIGGPGFSDPSAGATGNVVFGNHANGELRYGIAQAPGNPGNAYFLNMAFGNGVANFAIDP
jgi:parallel beta-helix repeat protein